MPGLKVLTRKYTRVFERGNAPVAGFNGTTKITAEYYAAMTEGIETCEKAGRQS